MTKNMIPFELRSLRVSLSWSQAEMARFLQCPIQQLQEWENGGLCPRGLVNQKLLPLVHSAERSSQRIQQTPSAEKALSENNLIQVCFSRLAS